MKKPEIGRTFWLIAFRRDWWTRSAGWYVLDIALFKLKAAPLDGEQYCKRHMQWGFWWKIHVWLPIQFDRTPA